VKLYEAVWVAAPEHPCFGAEGTITAFIDNHVVEVEMHPREVERFGLEELGHIRIPRKHLARTRDEQRRMRAGRELFGHLSVRHVFILPYPFINSYRKCMHNRCNLTAVRRGFVHEHETLVCEYDLCAKHSKQYHGESVVAFPDTPL
jgi:hypothetical protein